MKFVICVLEGSNTCVWKKVEVETQKTHTHAHGPFALNESCGEKERERERGRRVRNMARSSAAVASTRFSCAFGFHALLNLPLLLLVHLEPIRTHLFCRPVIALIELVSYFHSARHAPGSLLFSSALACSNSKKAHLPSCFGSLVSSTSSIRFRPNTSSVIHPRGPILP